MLKNMLADKHTVGVSGGLNSTTGIVNSDIHKAMLSRVTINPRPLTISLAIYSLSIVLISSLRF
ncbi:MAG: hypothetical protein QW374_05820 [Candidatus Bathyarchaeia archaeon]|nr:hypothetical protein [Candidatus Bathyarchaeota archaeon]